MGKLVASLNITLDGFCDHRPVIADEDFHRATNELLRGAAAVVLGRNTYGLFEHAWPAAMDDATTPTQMRAFAEQIHSIRKIVISKTLDHADWQNSMVISDLRKLDLLKQQSADDFVLLGSPGLLSMLAKRKMIDEFVFFFQPFLAGRGQRLFSEIGLEDPQKLRPNKTDTFSSGVVRAVYSRGT